jgi:hypothetical protein
MKKFLRITVGSATEMIAITGIASMQFQAGRSEIKVVYVDGSTVALSGSSALSAADIDVFADAVIAANESKWTSVVSQLPALSDTVGAVTFTVA